jgi:opacity protein-like surface antigen
MKKFAVILACLIAMPAFAEEYIDESDCYEYADNSANKYESYAGIRIHKNESIAFKYDVQDGGNSTVRADNFGFGAVVGNRLSNHVKLEFETSYVGIDESKRANKYDFDVWANMLNVYLFQEYEQTVAPYAGLGIGFATIWGDVNTPYGHMSDSVFDLSYSAMIGVNFALNERIDLNLGVKYQYYGEIEHKLHDKTFATTDVDATEFYFGAVYKFGI